MIAVDDPIDCAIEPSMLKEPEACCFILPIGIERNSTRAKNRRSYGLSRG